jgi:hypothetical protein
MMRKNMSVVQDKANPDIGNMAVGKLRTFIKGLSCSCSMHGSTKPILTEDLCVGGKKRIFSNMLYVRNVRLTEGQSHSYETNPTSRQRGCYIRDYYRKSSVEKLFGCLKDGEDKMNGLAINRQS